MAFLADKGCDDLLALDYQKVLPVVKLLVLPIKKALQTKRHDVVNKILDKIQRMCKLHPRVAESFVPYYR